MTLIFSWISGRDIALIEAGGMPVDEPERFDIPTAGRSSLEMFGAMRAYFEKVAAAKGKKLHPSWYDDGPERMPWLHKSRGEESRGD